MRTPLPTRIAAVLVAVGVPSCAQIIGLDQFHDGICTPGDTQSEDCPYTGPDGTKDVGICRAGHRTCAQDGQSWSTCSNEVKPLAQEDCSTPEDDNCDGQVNEASAGCCTPGEKVACYTGPEGTEGEGICKAGTQTCGSTGTIDGACAGDVLPKTELCTSTEDENCDGYDCVVTASLYGDGAAQAFLDIAVDAAGDTITSGVLLGSASVNGKPVSESGGGDAWLMKTKSDGTAAWSYAFGDGTKQAGGAVAIDSTGAIIFSGCTNAPFTLMGTALPAGDFIAKLSADGTTLKWATTLGTTGCGTFYNGLSAANTIAQIAVTSTNDIVIVGSFQGSIALLAAGGPIAAKGTKDGFIARLDGATGSTATGWVTTFGYAQVQQQANTVAIDPQSGMIRVGGQFDGTLSLGSTSASATGTDGFLAEIAYDGTPLWIDRFGGAGTQAVGAVGISAAGDYVLAGTFSGALQWGSTTLVSTGPTNQAFVIKCDTQGKYVWGKVYGGTDFFGAPTSVHLDGQGNVVFSGVFGGAVDFGKGTHQSPGSSSAGYDLATFLAKLSPSGDELWSRDFVGGAFAYNKTAVLPSGETAMAGFVSGAVNFGTGILTPGGTDAFVAKFGL